MSRTPNIFTDPTSGEQYAWEFNHLTEDTVEMVRNINESAPTSLGGLIRQQQANSPMRFTYSGTALTRHQHQQMLRWWQKCEHYTIHLTDFAGDVYEILIVSYQPKRRAVALNPRERGANPSVGAPLWVYDFSLSFEVVSFISGDYATAGITL